MDKKLLGTLALVVVACIAVVTAVAHMSCIVIGETCYRAQMAPEQIVKSATQGTLLAPIGTTLVSSLFLICAVYAFSAANFMKPMPFLRAGIFSISGLCILRGIATIPLTMVYPEKMTTFATLAGLTWFVSGVLCVTGYLLVNQSEGQSSKV